MLNYNVNYIILVRSDHFKRTDVLEERVLIRHYEEHYSQMHCRIQIKPSSNFVAINDKSLTYDMQLIKKVVRQLFILYYFLRHIHIFVYFSKTIGPWALSVTRVTAVWLLQCIVEFWFLFLNRSKYVF